MKSPKNITALFSEVLLICCLSLFAALPGLAQPNCINPQQINHNIACPTVYQPVCGCNGQTYSNSCEATYWYGVTSWTPGACQQVSCDASFTFQVNGNTVYFDNTSTGDYDFTHWSFGDGTGSNDGNVQHTYSSPGIYIACLTITDSTQSCYDYICDTITLGNNGGCINPGLINQNHNCSTMYEPVCGCNGITYHNSCKAKYYHGVTSWTQGPCGQQGNCNASFTYQVSGDTVFFDNTSTGDYYYTYWNFGDGHSSTDGNISHIYNGPGEYIVCLTVKDSSLTCINTYCDTITIGNNGGCIDPSLINQNQNCSTAYEPVCGCNGITYHNSCKAKFYHGVTSWTQGPCGQQGNCNASFTYQVSGDTVFFNNTSTGSSDFSHWNFGDGSGSYDTNISHIYNGSGEYIVCLTVNDSAQSCFDTFCDTITINPGPCFDQDLIDLNENCGNIYQPVCGCNQFTFANACEAINYGGQTSFTSGPCGNPAGCDAQFNFTVSGDTVVFANNSTGSYNATEWYFGDGTTSGDPNPTHVFSGPGTYTVCLVVSNNSQTCYSYKCKTVEIQGLCVDTSQIVPNETCPQTYEPVCGCNGITYQNVCIAKYHNGVTSWVPGVCGQQNNCNADFSYSVIVGIAGYTVTFYNTSTGNYNYSHWNFGDGAFSNQKHPIHTYFANTVNDSITVCLTISDSLQNCYDTYCETIYFEPTSCFNPSVVDSTKVCATVYEPVCGCNGVTYANSCKAYYWHGITSWTQGACNGGNACIAHFTYVSNGNTINFNNNSSGSYNIVHWDFGDGQTSNDPSPNHQYNQPGIYQVCLTISNNSNTCNETYCEMIHVCGNNTNCIDSSLIDLNEVCPLGIIPVCGCDGVTYNNACEAINYGGVTQWTEGPCNTSGCQADFDFTVTATTAGYQVHFTDQSSGNPDFYHWSFGDGSGSNQENPNHLYLQGGTYNVCLTISDSAQTCFDTYCKNIVIGNNMNCIDSTLIDTTINCPNVIEPVCGCNGETYVNSCVALYHHGVIHWTNGGCGGNVCHAEFGYSFNNTGHGVTFNNLSAGNYTHVYWSFGDGSSSTSTNPFHVFVNNQPTTYQVCLTIFNPNNNCYDQHCEYITVGGGNNDSCTSYFFWAQDANDPHSIVFTNFSEGNIDSVLWVFGDGSTSNSINVSHTYSESGVYEACLYVFNTQIGYTDTLCKTIYVNTTGLNRPEEEKFEVKVYPNPIDNKAVIEWTPVKDKNFVVRIYDSAGKLVINSEGLMTNKLWIERPDFTSGMYFFEVSTAGDYKRLGSGRFIVR